ncbi:DUF4255 domain-containing protein [Streptantibioticus cattleyicolor]|uniref:Pvc16 N-terminal domain-containing protein n=1 Tax=Streptantibioticus cattleyicolor (strain ATCC 35852 / DSM 46488 / JCM 4925 / NBRC 14057 / NRRL 8057) TaxID=1003195 RepID=F8JLE6_STREN|nr:DUF4255 domain-containing protein [Streptantibioticus cattleyicolor]AEW99558.1 hypothetical protein SCATT_p13650 [Streptantibioticus cattleyicolor NRRL 8057 = DSM 46488]CCB71403.1 conserved protein of unknown function [Streptantibioticus cattleyicolor NRRL 8057 = DSM 46488]
MIHEVDEALRLLLVEGGVQEGGVELVFDPPTRDWAARRNVPTISVFLYALREDAARRQVGWAEEYDADGLVVARRSTPHWFELAYLVTAWTNRPQDEHRLLSAALRCLVASDALPGRLLTGTLARLGLTVGLRTAGPGEGAPSVSDVWSALGGEMKPSVDLRVVAPLATDPELAAPAVTDGLLLRTEDHLPAPESAAARAEAGPARRLRYEGAEPRRDGFAAPRERPLPPGRRRRGGAPR